MLSRELCEQLAKAYPEDLRHIPQKGDLCYVSSLMDESLLYVGASGPTSEGWGARTFHFVSVLNGTEFYPEVEAQFRLHLRTGPMPGNVWDVRGDANIVVCPRLEDLLAIARHYVGRKFGSGEICLRLKAPPRGYFFGMESAPGNMSGWRWNSTAMYGDTPEEAVAHWLLAVAEEKPLDKEEARRHADRILGTRKEGE